MNANGGDFSGRPIWLADWTGEPSWRFDFRQYGCVDPHGPFPTRVCLDHYNGTVAQMQAKYGGAEPSPSQEEEEPMEVLAFDGQGNPTTVEALQEQFGEFQIKRSQQTGTVWRVAELHARTGDQAAVVIVKLLDANGVPVPGIACIRSWNGAPPLPDWSGLNPLPQRWYGVGVSGETNGNGDWGTGMGTGDYYDPSYQIGASSLWVGQLGVDTDCFTGSGMITATNHEHLDVWFKRVSGAPSSPSPSPSPSPSYSPSPSPSPSDEPPPYDEWTELMIALGQILTELKAIHAGVDAMHAALDAISQKLEAGWTVQ
jgi:hypothetical protein